MEKIKNIFDYATKELSQDAFLRWLLENYNCKNKKIREACYALLDLFGIKCEDDEIISIQTWAQWVRIDVLAEIKTLDGKNIVLAIEDKTNSSEHDQLEDYSKDIDKYYKKSKEQKNKHWIIKKVFYKTALENKNDIAACKKNGWDTFFIDEIFKVFNDEKFDNTNSELLDFYVKHIRKLHKDLTEISKDSMENWNYNNFYTYLDKTFVKNNTNRKDKIEYVMWGWRNIYPSMALIKMFDNHTRLSLEVVTRCKDEKNAYIKISTRKINKGNKNKPEEELNHSLKIVLKNYINDNLYFDSDSNEPLISMANSKNQIAKSNELLDNKLSYSLSKEEFSNTLNDIFHWFIKITNKELSEIVKEYGAKEYKEPKNFKYLIIKVRDDYVKEKENQSIKDPRYEVTRSCWKITKNRMNTNEFPYVFSVSNGIVREIYEVKEWTQSNKYKDRYEFEGKIAHDNKGKGFIKNDYLNKRIPSYYTKKGMANPVLSSKN